MFKSKQINQVNPLIDVQGHRGCRGLQPENSIPAFLFASELGVDTLEMDAVISKDHQVIISHEPFFSHKFSTSPSGTSISKADEKNHNIYNLTYSEIQAYDTGLRLNPDFPNQAKVPAYKPSLAEVVIAVRRRLTKLNKSHIYYNIEIKRKKEWDMVFHPDYKQFSDLVIKEVDRLNILKYTTIQCFDIETLVYIKSNYPLVKLVYLVSNLKPFKSNFKKLGFVPDIYSPHYKLVNRRLLSYCHERKIKVIPWTVNEIDTMKNLIQLGVTSIITDYPDRLISVINNYD